LALALGNINDLRQWWEMSYKGMKMQYPATRWQDAIPLGNGIAGALVFGNISEELLVINHDRLYLHKYKRPEFKDVSGYLPEARRLMANGRYEEGFQYLNKKFGEGFSGGGTTDPFQPFCDLHIRTGIKGPFINYSRELCFGTGEAKISWEENNAFYSRRQFVSREDDLIVVGISSREGIFAVLEIGLSASGILGATGMGSGSDVSGEKPSFAWESTADHEYFMFTAILTDGTSIGAVGRVVTDSRMESVRDLDSDISFIKTVDSSDVLLLVKLFINEDKQDAVQRIKAELAACNHTYDELLDRHTALHGPLFNRCRLELYYPGGNENERLLLDCYNGDHSGELVQKMFDYGRYLLIASTADGGMPPNLQGIWNGDYNPAWSSDFHNDENIQMNHWAALPGNLPEAMLPLFDYYTSLMDDFKENASKLYGCRGILLPICNTTHGLIYTPTIWNGWTGAAAWMAWHYFDYYLYTQDKQFLKEKALPFMKETALFYLDFFITDQNGRLSSMPSMSPENKPLMQDSIVVQNATMDFALARQVLTNLLASYDILDIDDMREEFERLLAKIPAYEINDDGAVSEWMHESLKDNYHHRHMSHIYPLFPAIEITKEKDGVMFRAMKDAVRKRQVSGLTAQTGWSLAHMANIYARLGEGDEALECIDLICRSCTGTNLFTYHNDWRSQGLSMYWGHGSRPPFQIDANFGIVSAILEMLVQSRDDGIKLLPALPAAWGKGAVKGLRARGGFVIDITWKDGIVEEARIKPDKNTGPCSIITDMEFEVSCEGGHVDTIYEDGILKFDVSNRTYILKP